MSNQEPKTKLDGGASVSTAMLGATGEPAYLTEVVTQTIFKYNPKYGDDRVCKCGHSYYRHFDSYENMEPIGCKYCGCMEFEEAHNCEVTRATPNGGASG